MNDSNECLSAEQINRFVHDTPLPSEEVQAADAHLQHCAHCRQSFQSASGQTAEQFLKHILYQDDSASDAVSQEDLAGCLDEEMMGRYAQGATDDFENEMVEMHLEDCAYCKAEITFLQTLRREMGEERRPGFTDWLISQWQSLRRHLIPIPAKPLLSLTFGAVTAACILFVFLVLPLRKQLRLQVVLRQEEQQKSEQNGTLLAQSKAQLQTQKDTLRGTQNELADLRKKQQALLSDVVRLPIQEAGEPLLSDKQGRIGRIQWLPPTLAKSLTNPQLALASGQKNLQAVALEPSQEMGVKGKQETHVEPVSPIASIVEAQQPALRWKPLAGAAHYKVTMRIPDGDTEIRGSDFLTGTEWSPPSTLSRGTVYQWQVLAFNAKKERIAQSNSNSVKFKVLDAQTAQRLTEFAGSPLTRCTLYVNAGMPDEAEKELQLYLKENLTSPTPTIQQLKTEIQTLKQKKQTFTQRALQPR